jgi:hypothetical protein
MRRWRYIGIVVLFGPFAILGYRGLLWRWYVGIIFLPGCLALLRSRYTRWRRRGVRRIRFVKVFPKHWLRSVGTPVSLWNWTTGTLEPT